MSENDYCILFLVGWLFLTLLSIISEKADQEKLEKRVKKLEENVEKPDGLLQKMRGDLYRINLRNYKPGEKFPEY